MPERILRTSPGHPERALSEGRERHGGEAESRAIYDSMREAEEAGAFDREDGFSGFEDFTENNFGTFNMATISSLWEKFLAINPWTKLVLVAGVLFGGMYIADEIDRRKRFR